ncbi:MAG: C-GCAxxG-C-C family protein [Anaerolineae bacterium]
MLAVGGHLLPGLEPQCLRMATPLAGGLGSSHQETCGALSGGTMVIGGLLGRITADEDDEPAQALARRYRELFFEEMGATRCEPIRNWVQGPEGPGSCSVVVERAARILLAILEETGR